MAGGRFGRTLRYRCTCGHSEDHDETPTLRSASLATAAAEKQAAVAAWNYS